MHIYVKKDCDTFEVGIVDATGSPRVGRGKSMNKALVDFLRIYQKALGIESITLDEEATKVEVKRRKKELANR